MTPVMMIVVVEVATRNVAFLFFIFLQTDECGFFVRRRICHFLGHPDKAKKGALRVDRMNHFFCKRDY